MSFFDDPEEKLTFCGDTDITHVDDDISHLGQREKFTKTLSEKVSRRFQSDDEANPA